MSIRTISHVYIPLPDTQNTINVEWPSSQMFSMLSRCLQDISAYIAKYLSNTMSQTIICEINFMRYFLLPDNSTNKHNREVSTNFLPKMFFKYAFLKGPSSFYPNPPELCIKLPSSKKCVNMEMPLLVSSFNSLWGFICIHW